MKDRNNTPLPDLAIWSSTPRAPRLIAGRYKVEGKLGQGGMGRVYKCHDSVLERSVAVKLVNHNLEEQYFARFHQEAKAASQLNHHNILHILDFGLTEDRQPYMVMELVAGETIDEILNRIGSFPLPEALEIIAKVCLGMQHAHSQGVIHRDLKTSNIMIAKRGDQATIPLILDFGIAKVLNSSDDKGMLTRTGEIMGSPKYMSPEQAAGQVVDGRSDIYSLGCVLFEMLTGQPPFDANSAMETIYMHLNDPPPSLLERSNVQFPDYLEALMAKLLQKNPGNRFSSMQEVSDELFRAQHRLEESQPATTSSTPPTKQNSNAAIILVSIVTAAIITIAGAAVLLYVFEPRSPSGKSTLNLDNPIYEATPEQNFDEGEQTVLRKCGAPIYNGHGITDKAGLEQAIAKRDKVDSLHLSEGRFDKEMMDYLLSQKNIDELTFSDVDISKEVQEVLFTNPRIKSLRWSGKIFRPVLANLDRMYSLTELQLARANLTDADISNILRAEHLTELELNLNKQLSGKALARLSNLKDLNHLNVSDTDLTNEELVQLACIAQITKLDVSNNMEIDSGGVLQFWRQRKKKTPLRLYVVSCRSIPVAAQQAIHKAIPKLDLRSTHKKSDILSESALGGMLNYDDSKLQDSKK